MKKEEILLKVWRSRKAYLFFYLVAVAIGGGLIYFYLNGIGIPSTFLVVSVVLIVLIIKLIEIHRIREWWAITDLSFIESKGIINKNIREIAFDSISDVDLKQALPKRLLGYGTVNIRRFLNETIISVVNINHPERFVNLLQDAIHSNKLSYNEKGI